MEYTKLKFINQYKSESINPAKTPDTVFEMYSVPIYETGHPEFLRGDEIASNKAVVQKNDILLCKINPRINRVWVVSDESDKMNIASSEWIVIRNSEYNPEFLAWYFRTPKFQKLMTSEVTGIGGSLTRAQPKCVAEYPVPVLDRVKQDEIVAILNKCKFIIESRKQELDALDDLIKARFVELFGVCDTYELLKDSNIYISDGNYSSKYPTADEFVEEGIPFIRASNMEMNTIVDNNMYFITKEKHAILLKGHVKAGDVLITTRGATIGKIACVPPRHEGSNINAQIVLLRCPKKEYNPLFLSWYLKLENTQAEIQKLISGSAQPQLPIKRLMQLNLLKPDINLQNQFAAFVEQTDKSKVAVKKALDEAQLLFDSLMQKYFG